MTRMRKQSKLQIANTACSTLNILNNDLNLLTTFLPSFCREKDPRRDFLRTSDESTFLFSYTRFRGRARRHRSVPLAGPSQANPTWTRDEQTPAGTLLLTHSVGFANRGISLTRSRRRVCTESVRPRFPRHASAAGRRPNLYHSIKLVLAVCSPLSLSLPRYVSVRVASAGGRVRARGGPSSAA